MYLFTTLVIISEVGQRINLIFLSSDNVLNCGEIDDNLPKKHALFTAKIGHDIKRCLSSSISPDMQYEQVLEDLGICLYLPNSIPNLLEEDRKREIQDLWFQDNAQSI